MVAWRASCLRRVLEVSPPGGDHFPNGSAKGVQTLHARLQPGLHLLDDSGDAPDLVPGQADDEGHHRALDRYSPLRDRCSGNTADAAQSSTHDTLVLVVALPRRRWER